MDIVCLVGDPIDVRTIDVRESMREQVAGRKPLLVLTGCTAFPMATSRFSFAEMAISATYNPDAEPQARHCHHGAVGGRLC